MNAQEFTYTTESNKSVNDTVVALLKAIEQKGGWTVFQIYDIQERLAAKGFTHPPLKIIEVCSAKYASQFLNDDLLTSLCMPCKINAYQDGERVLIALMKPSIVAQFFPNANAEKALQAEKELIEIIENALKQAAVFKCEKCGVKYEEKKWADACRAWCETHAGVCSLEIIKHATKHA